MTAHRDPDRLVGAFLEEGPAELSPRLTGAIRDDIRHTDQRSPRRPWRMPTMTRPMLILVPLAAIVLLGGALLLGGGSNRQAPPGTPSPSPVASAAGVASSPTPGSAGSPSPAASIFPIADGEPWIAFETNDSRVALIRPDGTGRHLVLDAPDNMQQTPDWSPDGSRLAFARDYGFAGQLWAVDADGSNGVALTTFNDRCAPLCSFARSPRWSRDGTTIAYIEDVADSGRTVSNAVMLLDVASGTTRKVYETTSDVLRFPAWSPDGTKIALEVDHYKELGADGARPASTTVAIVDLKAARPVPVPIPGLPALAGHPDWNADGSGIVYRTNPFSDIVSLDPTAGTTIGVISPGGGDARVVLESPADGDVLRATAWSPDGRSILFAPIDRATTTPTLRVVSTDGTGDASLTGSVITPGGEPRLRPLP